jgi:galactokinase
VHTELQYRVSAPGRVNLIGEHIDYHGLPVFPMALRRCVTVCFAVRADSRILAESAGFEPCAFEWRSGLEPTPAGDWSNYLRAAALAVAGKWGVGRGIDALITSDLPAAAGLSSSSALLVAVALSLLRANEWTASFDQLMEILPDGEQFVGTRGGGMDHAASLGSRAGYATLIHFHPVQLTHVPVPEDWAFLVIDSRIKAEKAGAVRERYNYIRDHPDPRHVPVEAERVLQAVEAMKSDGIEEFGRLMLASHASLRDNLRVSHPELDCIVETAVGAGACGARLTGAGFGGSAVALCRRKDVESVRAALAARWPVIEAEPGDGALAQGSQTS